MTETANVDCAERYERRPWRMAAESYGRDVRNMLQYERGIAEEGILAELARAESYGNADVIRLYARIAARFARVALQEQGPS